MKKQQKKAAADPRVESKNNNFTASDFFSAVEAYPEKNKLLFVFGLLLLMGFFVFKDYLLLHSIFLFKDIGSDTINYNYSNWLHISSYLHADGIPAWSFNQGMGQNIFFTPEGINDPFCWILYLCGTDNLPYAIGYAEFCKVLLGGTFFYLYLRTLGFSFYSCLIGAMLFAFSGYMILGGTWIIFSSEAVGAAF